MGIGRSAVAAAVIIVVGGVGIDRAVYRPAESSVSRLEELAKAQDAYDKEHAAGCAIAKSGAQDGAGEHKEGEPEGGAEDGGDHDVQPVTHVRTGCSIDTAAIANRIAFEAVRGSTATVHFTFLAAVVAILALLGALLSAGYARESLLIERDARRGRVGVGGIARGLTDVRFDVVNVGEVPILLGAVSDRSLNAYRRDGEGLVLLGPGDRLGVSAPRVSSRIHARISFTELSGRRRITTAELRSGSADWVLDALRERK